MKYKIIFGLLVISLLSSLVLTLTPIPAVCRPGEGCDIVRTSEYAYTFGIPNPYYGVLIFSFLCLLTLSHMKWPHKRKKQVIHSGVIIGSIVAIYFIYLQHFVLQAYCKYCLVVDFSVLIALGILLMKEG
jgi:uncharacterized membrane protein